jgi:hypothetical protein
MSGLGATPRASTVPLLLFSILFGLVAIGGIVGRAIEDEYWQNANLGVPYAQIAFATHCALARRPGQRVAMALVIVAFLVWNFVLLALFAQVMGFPIFYGYFRMNTATAGFMAWTIVVATLVYRSFARRERTQIKLWQIFVLIATAAALMALYVSDPNAGDIRSVIRFHGPHVVMYWVAVWSVFTLRYPLIVSTAMIGASAGMGYAVTHRGIAPWPTMAECAVYSATLIGSLWILRAADFYARAPGADASASMEQVSGDC